MTSHTKTFAMPDTLEPNLTRVHVYWAGLKRGENAMPFADDVKLSGLSSLSRDAALVEVFGAPPRFRFDLVGESIAQHYGESVTGKFSDEVAPRAPLDAFTAQCRATVEGRAPTYYRHSPAERSGQTGGYARLVLPLWANGQVEMLLAAVTQAD